MMAEVSSNLQYLLQTEERYRVNVIFLMCSSPHRERCALTIIYKKENLEEEETGKWHNCGRWSFWGGCCELIVPVSVGFPILLLLPFL
jgi:hypothetical protein